MKRGLIIFPKIQVTGKEMVLDKSAESKYNWSSQVQTTVRIDYKKEAEWLAIFSHQHTNTHRHAHVWARFSTNMLLYAIYCMENSRVGVLCFSVAMYDC